MQKMKGFIFIHGLGQTSRSWDRTLAYLPEDIKSTLLDLPSLCRGEKITYSNLYTAFRDYCKNISEPVNLCGVSLGAVLALNYAIECPQKVNLLALIAPQYKMPNFLIKLQSLIFNFMPQSAFNELGFNKKDFSILTRSMSDLDFSNTVKNVSCSPLIICGKRDKANMKAANELAIKIPNAKLHLIENAGHEVNVDTPEELATILKSHFQFDDKCKAIEYNRDKGKPEHCRKCKIKDCIKDKELSYCLECSDYPCKLIKNLEKSYNKRYQASLIENSEFVRQHGLEAFIRKQKEKYTCSKCGGIISIHDKECSDCQEKIE